MADTRKYYWLKLNEGFFRDKKMKKLRRIAGGDTFTIIYLKMQLLSLKTGGRLIFEGVEESFVEEIALEIDEEPDNVAVTVRYLISNGLLEEVETDSYILPEAIKSMGSESSSAERVRRHRAKKRTQLPEPAQHLPAPDADALHCNTEVTNGNTEIEKEIDIEIEIDKEKEIEKIDYSRIINLYNDICISFPRLRTLSDTRKKAIKARINSGYTYEDFETMFIKAETSTFLKGGNDRDWSATFDWMLKDANMAKILDGNYDNKKVATPKNQQKSSNPFLNRLKEMGEV